MIKIKQLLINQLLVILVLLSCFSAVCSSCNSNESDELELFVWEIQPGPGYLIGTIHIVPEGVPRISDKYFKLISESEIFMMEADPADFTTEIYNQFALYQENDQLLSTLVSEEVWQQLTQLAKINGIPKTVFNTVKPWALGVEIMMSQIIDPTTGITPVTMDELLHSSAVAAKLELDYLETAASQLKAFDEMPLDYQLEQLIQYLEDPDYAPDKFQQLFTHYSNGDIDAVEHFLFEVEGLKDRPELVKQIMENRNRQWLPLIQNKLSRGRVVIAVGVGHMVGPGNLLDLLKEEGYTIEFQKFPENLQKSIDNSV